MPSEQRYAEVERYLYKTGWQLLRSRGSHFTFFKRGVGIYVVVVHNGKVKPRYVEDLKKINRKTEG